METNIYVMWHKGGTVWRKILTVENIDEFDEFSAIRQYFPYQIFHSIKYSYLAPRRLALMNL